MNNNELSKNKNVVKSDLQGGLDIPVKVGEKKHKKMFYRQFVDLRLV